MLRAPTVPMIAELSGEEGSPLIVRESSSVLTVKQAAVEQNPSTLMEGLIVVQEKGEEPSEEKVEVVRLELADLIA